MFDYLTSTVLSGMVYDAICAGATIGVDMLKSVLQDWIVDDGQICKIVEKMKEAGINEDLNPQAIERKINQHQLFNHQPINYFRSKTFQKFLPEEQLFRSSCQIALYTRKR